MTSSTLISEFPIGASITLTWTQWLELFEAKRSWTWLAPAATVIVIGMLAVFYQVVQGAVQQGELKRKTYAALVEANWRCNAAKDLSARNNCQRQLLAAAGD